MATGSFIKEFGGQKLIVDWTSTPNAETNKSSVIATLSLLAANNYSLTSRSGNTITINGVEKSFSTPAFEITKGEKVELGVSDAVEVEHNADGTKSIIIAGVFRFLASLSGTYYSNIKATDTVILDTIPKQSRVSATAAYVGEATTITINKSVSTYTHTLKYQFGTLSGTIATKTTSSTVNWTVPSNFANQITNATSGTATIICETYNGTELVGTSSCNMTVMINESASAPILSLTVIDENATTKALTGNTSTIVKYFSELLVNGVATAQGGATIKSCTVSNGNQKYTASGNVVPGTFTNIETNEFFVSAIDSRSNAKVSVFYPTMIDYIKLTCNLEAPSPSTSGTTRLSIKGNYFNGSFGARSNTLTVQYRYKTSSGSYSSWYSASASKSGNTYTATPSISGLNYRETYTFEARASDALMTVSSNASAMTTPVFDWSGDDFNINVPTTLQDDLSVAGELTIGGKKLVDLVYPVGAIYMSVNSTSPATLFGGSWVAWGSGRVPVGINTSDSNFSTVERTGGSSSVSLTTAQLPAHNHEVGANYNGENQHDLFLTGLSSNAAGFNGLSGIGRSAKVDSVSSAEDYYYFRSDNQQALGYAEATASTGSGSAHTNLQPYIVCYMWKRTA